jgi:hypothetical protein
MNRYLATSMRFALISLVAICAMRGNGLAFAADRSALSLAAASITREELKQHVDVLADDTLEGREAGSRGGRAAGNYLLKVFESKGLSPVGDSGTYFQSFGGASRNILGLLPGSDPQLAQQVILIGAHYDHVGYGRASNSYGPTGYIHNGADDNASGVAGLLEVVDAIKQMPQAPKRSILFACWDGEEQGLLGSRHWVGRPTVALSRVALAINLDMIGRMQNSTLEILGTRTAHGLRRLASEANVEASTVLDFDWKLKPDSDHWPFYERRIPFLMFHTGLHGDYHRPSDDAHRINHAGLAETTKIIFHLLADLANAPQVPSFRDAARREPQTAYQLEQPHAPPPSRYGIPFRTEPADEPKIILTGITPGSPAEKSGLKAGDRVLEFQGQPIKDEGQFRLELLAARGETTFLVERAGSSIPQLLKVTPSGEPIRVGVMWRTDEGEPGTVILTQVVYGSAAHLAGLKVGDRVYAVGGRPFQTQEEFSTLLTTVGSPLELRVERSGKVRNAVLNVLDEPPAGE